MQAKVVFKVPFHDVDVMYIVWHGHYLKYFELARTELMQSMQLDWPHLKDLGVAMPVVAADQEYKQALRYGEIIMVEASIQEYEYPTLEVHYKIQSQDGTKLYTRGKTKQVYMDIEKSQILYEVPGAVLDRFKRR